MKFIIYKHTNTITNKAYVGYTSSTLEKRFDRHIQDTKRGSQLYFHRSIRKHGIDCWTSEVLCECKSLHKAWTQECEMIAKYDTFGKNGYNMTAGGGGPTGRTMSEEDKQKSRLWHLRFRHTEESKKFMKKKFTKLRGRSVNQYTKNGLYITTFDSCVQAAESLGNKKLCGNIQQICAGTFKHWTQSTVKGFQWKFNNGDTSNIEPAVDLNTKRIKQFIERARKSRAIQQLTTTGELVKRYPSSRIASSETGIYLSGIQRCCIGKLKTAGGYVWVWD